MRLAFYSGGSYQNNEALNQKLLDLIGKPKFSISYIPSNSKGAEPFFEEFRDYYSELGASQIKFCPIDRPESGSCPAELFEADVVFLSGGNTFYFLNSLKSHNLLDQIHAFVQKGGVLWGLSAGSIVMTPRIDIARFPSDSPDNNDVGISNLSALGLTSFEFFPHYSGSKLVQMELAAYSQNTPTPIIACPEGSGIVIDGHSISLIGSCNFFCNGQMVDSLVNLSVTPH